MTNDSGLLGELLDLMGCGQDAVAAPVRLTDRLTGPRGHRGHAADSKMSRSDRSDRSDRYLARVQTNSPDPEPQHRFVVGQRYRQKRVERLCRMNEELRLEADEAGFPNAGIVVIEGEALLIDDVRRFMVDDTFLVLGYAEVPTGNGTAQALAPRKKRRGR